MIGGAPALTVMDGQKVEDRSGGIRSEPGKKCLAGSVRSLRDVRLGGGHRFYKLEKATSVGE
jgi:hypothetical protein